MLPECFRTHARHDFSLDPPVIMLIMSLLNKRCGCCSSRHLTRTGQSSRRLACLIRHSWKWSQHPTVLPCTCLQSVSCWAKVLAKKCSSKLQLHLILKLPWSSPCVPTISDRQCLSHHLSAPHAVTAGKQTGVGCPVHPACCSL